MNTMNFNDIIRVLCIGVCICVYVMCLVRVNVCGKITVMFSPLVVWRLAAAIPDRRLSVLLYQLVSILSGLRISSHPLNYRP